ncbi:hypothetical protein JCM15060_24570 [Halanaerobaculum tunisiense]
MHFYFLNLHIFLHNISQRPENSSYFTFLAKKYAIANLIDYIYKSAEKGISQEQI